MTRASLLFWELLTGAAAVGFILACATLEVGVALLCVALLAVCLYHWARVGWGPLR